LPGYNLKTFIPAQREAAGDMGSRNDSEGDIEKVIFKLLTVYLQLIDMKIWIYLLCTCKSTWIGWYGFISPGIHGSFSLYCIWVRVMVFITFFNNISVISWRSVLLVEENGIPEENHRPVSSHWQTLSHNVVSGTPCHEWDSNSQLYMYI
jgi:hypothetical protein